MQTATRALLRCMVSCNQLSHALATVLQRTSLNELRHMFSIWIRWLVDIGSELTHFNYSCITNLYYLPEVLQYSGMESQYLYSNLNPVVSIPQPVTGMFLNTLPLMGAIPAILKFIATCMRSSSEAQTALLEANIFTLLLAIVDGEVRRAWPGKHRKPPPSFAELSLQQVAQEASMLIDELRASKKMSQDWSSFLDVVQATAVNTPGDGSRTIFDAYESARQVFLRLREE